MEIKPHHLTLADLFHKRLFRIPQYQRAYSWEEKHRNALFDDIHQSYNQDSGQSHFMATIVGLRREERQIGTDNYWIIDIVDGQQRITTLVILYRAIAKALDRGNSKQNEIYSEINSTLIKSDDVCPVLLQTNHDHSSLFLNYIRTGENKKIQGAYTLAEREIIRAATDCEKFVEKWRSRELLVEDLYIHLKNNLSFILHEIENESLVYTVFEVLNSRGLIVPWFDRLKSMLMAIVFKENSDTGEETINQIQKLWSEIYRILGLRIGMNREILRFAATLRSKRCPSSVFNEENSAKQITELTGNTSNGVVKETYWVKEVAEALDELLKNPKINAVTRIAHARLFAVSLNLRKDFDEDQKNAVLRRWESVTFRIFGMCGKDARTKRGDYVRLAWRTLNEELSFDEVMNGLQKIGQDYPIEGAIEKLRKTDCYYGWGRELRYLMFRREQYLSTKAGQVFDNEQWSRIWASSSSDSIEHILPVSSEKTYIHWLGNLVLLPPKLNSSLKDKSPTKKVKEYFQTGLLIAQDVANMMEKSGKWNRNTVLSREDELVKWARKQWAD